MKAELAKPAPERNYAALLRMLSQLRSADGVADLKVDQIRGLRVLDRYVTAEFLRIFAITALGFPTVYAGRCSP